MTSKVRSMISRVMMAFRRNQEPELDQELMFHIDELTDRNVRAGMTAEEGRRRALIELGGLEQTREDCRDALGVRMFRDLLRDLQYGARQLHRAPRFAAAAILSLALGIGASTAIFSLVDAVLFRSLPYPKAERILSLNEVDAQGRRTTFAEPNYQDVRVRSHSLSYVAEYNSQLTTVLGGREAVRAQMAAVSIDFFSTLGVQPAVGRAFLQAEARPGGTPVAVVSQGFWQAQLDGRMDLAARPLRIYDTDFAVVGVMPAGFNFPRNAAIWLPIEQYPSSPSRTSHGKRCIARLAEGTTINQARADLSAIGRQLKVENGKDIDLVDISAVSLLEALAGSARSGLLLTLGAVALLMLVSCSNVVTLTLAQSTTRFQEFSVRAALGANLPRLARQLFAENLLLALSAGGLGVLLSIWGVSALLGLNRGNLPRADEISVDARALGFSLGLVLVVALALSLVPLLRIRRHDLETNLKDASRRHSAGTTSQRVRQVLVAAQVTMTLILLVGSTLLLRSFGRVLQVDPGFFSEGAVAMQISVPWADSAESLQRMARFYQLLIGRISALPGVAAAGGVNGLPLAGGGADGEFLIDNSPLHKGYGEFRIASPDYFRAMGIRLLRGRIFDESDGSGDRQTAVISESLARQYFLKEDPLGRTIQYGNMDGDMTLLHIIGIVADVREFGLEAMPRPTVYAHYLQRPRQASDFAVVARTRSNTGTLIRSMRDTLWALDRNVPATFHTLDQIYSDSLSARRFSMVIFIAFAGAALALAVIGIYGVTSYAVTQRTAEIGIRMALGAQIRDIVRLTIGYGIKAVIAGTAIGLAGSLALTRLMVNLMFDVSTTDPLTFTVVPALMFVVALVACYLPARRAAKVNPITALRCE